ncbi:MAG: UbiH/UbiF/VisC/COQ6 family ubiquinone biosynthesis hydroxylase [Woeseiaceae bacterium]|nr:UbiH/UbiF/VisC/COQ6 family ubiquinone biosynthesis hydroxylase [Woeseiaceae bacterium]
MRRDVSVVVVGAGVTGLTAAALLKDNVPGIGITVVDIGPRPESRPDDELDLRVSAIAPGSVDILTSIGAWTETRPERRFAYDRMRVWDAADEVGGPSTLRFDADEFAMPCLGYIVENRSLTCALLSAVAERDVALRFSSPLGSIEQSGNGHDVVLENGSRLYADLIVAADGGRSFVRDSFDIEVDRRPYSQTAFVTHLLPARSHEATAWQRFLSDGPFAMLPLADGRVSIVWSTTPEKAAHAEDCSEDELGDLMTELSDGVLGRLTPAGPRGSFPLAAQHAKEYVRHGLSLIGDAAHTIHPLAGQGANLGLADAAKLAQVLADARDAGEHIGDRPVLRRYERARRGANATMMQFMTGLNRLFASDSAVLGEMRRLGMTLFNASGPLRSRIAGVALGRH